VHGAAGLIDQAISQMDNVTQQNASLVEEAAAASEALQEQAGKLSDLVSVFRIDGVQGRVEPVAVPKVPVKAPVALARPAAALPRTPVPAKPKAKAVAPAASAAASRFAQPAKSVKPAVPAGEGDWEEF
jgi:hypothetical protein